MIVPENNYAHNPKSITHGLEVKWKERTTFISSFQQAEKANIVEPLLFSLVGTGQLAT